MLLNNQWVPKEIRENSKTPGHKWKWKHHDPKSMGCSKSTSKREVYNNTSLPQEIRKILNKQSNLTPRGTKKRRTNKTQS